MLDNKVWSINFEAVSLEKGESYDLSDLIANRICSLGFAEIDNGGEEKIQQESEEPDDEIDNGDKEKIEQAPEEPDDEIDNGGEEKIEQEPEDSDIDTKLENAEEPKRKKRGRKPKIE